MDRFFKFGLQIEIIDIGIAPNIIDLGIAPKLWDTQKLPQQKLC